MITSEHVRVSPAPPEPDSKRTRLVWTAVFIAAAFFVGLLFRTGPKIVVAPDGESLGPRRIVAGVPVGYDRSQEGAMAAAGNYVVALDGPLLVKEDARSAMVRAIVAAETQAERLRLTAASAESNRRAFGDDWQMWTAPIATNVASYSDSRAIVQVWRAVVVGGTPEYGLETWATEAVELVWQDNDWKYLRQTTSDGPTPLQDPNSTVTPGKDLLMQVQGWERFWHAPLPRKP